MAGKPRIARKDDRLAIRMSAEQKRALERKARRRGLSLSSWLLSLGLAAPDEPSGAPA